MIVLNFTHPLNEEHLQDIKALTGQPVQDVIAIKCYFDVQRPFAEQARELLDGLGWDAETWQTTPLLVNPPALNVIAATVLAELQGRHGHFPAVLRLRPVANTTPTQFEVAEVLNLDAIRDQARQER